jgi:hypothetical protein
MPGKLLAGKHAGARLAMDRPLEWRVWDAMGGLIQKWCFFMRERPMLGTGTPGIAGMSHFVRFHSGTLAFGQACASLSSFPG